jgi:hypothetical protein
VCCSWSTSGQAHRHEARAAFACSSLMCLVSVPGEGAGRPGIRCFRSGSRGAQGRGLLLRGASLPSAPRSPPSGFERSAPGEGRRARLRRYVLLYAWSLFVLPSRNHTPKRARGHEPREPRRVVRGREPTTDFIASGRAEQRRLRPAPRASRGGHSPVREVMGQGGPISRRGRVLAAARGERNYTTSGQSPRPGACRAGRSYRRGTDIASVI